MFPFLFYRLFLFLLFSVELIKQNHIPLPPLIAGPLRLFTLEFSPLDFCLPGSQYTFLQAFAKIHRHFIFFLPYFVPFCVQGV